MAGNTKLEWRILKYKSGTLSRSINRCHSLTFNILSPRVYIKNRLPCLSGGRLHLVSHLAPFNSSESILITHPLSALSAHALPGLHQYPARASSTSSSSVPSLTTWHCYATSNPHLDYRGCFCDEYDTTLLKPASESTSGMTSYDGCAYTTAPEPMTITTPASLSSYATMTRPTLTPVSTPDRQKLCDMNFPDKAAWKEYDMDFWLERW